MPRQPTARRSYDGVVACQPVTVPYVRYSVESAAWWIGRAVHQLAAQSGLRPRDIDGFSLSSFTAWPDTAIGLTQHLGLSPRWLDHIPLGGASGVVALNDTDQSNLKFQADSPSLGEIGRLIDQPLTGIGADQIGPSGGGRDPHDGGSEP